MKRKLLFGALALVATGCGNTVGDLYVPPTAEEETTSSTTVDEQLREQKSGWDYAAQFSNSTEIHVSIRSDVSTYYALFAEYPYTEVDEENVLTAEPLMQGKTPIDIQVTVPSDVQTLYLYSWEGIRELSVKDITINDVGTRAEAADDAVLREVRQAAYDIFPEMTYNFRRDELYKCTDLVIAENASTKSFETANVTLTYLGDGNFGSSGNNITLYMYTYPTEKQSTLTLDDCTFYGLDSKTKKPVEVTYAQVYAGTNPIFKHKDCRNKFTMADMGDFPKGLSVGFCMNGTRTNKVKFSTPQLNPNDMYAGQTIIDKGTKVKARSSNTQVLYYNDGKGDFTFDTQKHVASAFIKHYVASDGQEYNILGCDNTLPFELTPRSDGKFQCSFDGDYNDFLAMVQTTPNAIEPSEDVQCEEVAVSSTSHGYYIFEDQYPDKGDFDFNDIVMEYRATHYVNNVHEVSVRVAAVGCGYSNTFGFYDEYGRVEVKTHISGKVNVFPDTPVVLDDNGWTTVRLTGTWGSTITPFLYNGIGEVSVKTYNTDSYPYVLDIPYNETYPFRWCIEGKSLEDAYHFNSGDGWYLVPVDESLVVKR